MKLTIIMDNGTRYKVSESITDKLHKTDVSVVLSGLGLMKPTKEKDIHYEVISLDDDKTNAVIRIDKIYGYEYTI